MLMRIEKLKKSKKGFTLIELIVVIAILGILAAIAVPRIGGFTETARIASDEQVASNLASAGAIYYASHGTLPTVDNLLTDKLTSYADVAAVIAAIKSDKYKPVASATVVFTQTNGAVTVTIDGAADLISTK